MYPYKFFRFSILKSFLYICFLFFVLPLLITPTISSEDASDNNKNVSSNSGVIIDHVSAQDVCRRALEHAVTVGEITISGPNVFGSGTVLGSKDGTRYILTAHHVIEHLISEASDNGNNGKKSQCKDIPISKRLYNSNHEPIGKIYIYGTLIHFDKDLDLALVKLPELTKELNDLFVPCKLANEKYYPVIGDCVCHVGSFFGEAGAESVSLGHISFVSRKLENKIYDQTTCPAMPGSSGGGVFNMKNEYIGMVVRGYNNNFILFTPTRVIYNWFKTIKFDQELENND